MKCFVVLFGLVAVTMAMTTTHKPHHSHQTHDPNHTKEPSEHEKFGFYYVPATNHLIISNGKTCYVASLTADEQANIHTDSGLRSVELRLLNQITQATTVTKDSLNSADTKHCSHHATSFFTIS